MPVSQGFGGSGLPGKTLKAWVHMTSAGAVLSSFNVTSVSAPGSGLYNVTFTAPMTGSDYIAIMTPSAGGNSNTGRLSGATTAVATLQTVNLGGSGANVGGLWVFYE